MLTRRHFTALTLAGLATTLGLSSYSSLMRPAVYTGPVPGVALAGIDPVSYVIGGEPQPGRADLTHGYSGAIWRFAGEQNLEAFRADPVRFAPQFGGYCAYAVAGGGVAPGDPRFWMIVDGRLYLNASRRVHDKWTKDPLRYIASGNANWPQVLRRL